jgi:hypothetical protein
VSRLSSVISEKKKALTFGFNSAYDVFEKLKRDAEKLRESPLSKDECFNFVITAWHLHHDWMKKDVNLSQLAIAKHEKSKSVMKSMMHALEVVANASKHITARNNKNVKDTKLVEQLDYYSYYKSSFFPAIITDKAEYTLWKLQQIMVAYFEWIFDESETNADEMPGPLSELINSSHQET